MTTNNKRVFTETEKEQLRERMAQLNQEREKAEFDKIALESVRQQAIKKAIKDAEFEIEQLKYKKKIALKKQINRQINIKKNLLFCSFLINKHSATLILKYSRCLTQDEYGRVVFNKTHWDMELNYFISKVLAEEFDKILFEQLDQNEIRNEINDLVASVKPVSKTQNNKILDGAEFEILCADILKSLGWQTSLTKGSGDQGIDIIATKLKTVVVLQCKSYTGSVGNEAVQEILGGKEMIKANFAAVVTNSTYTKSARQLAANSGTMLLHQDQLSRLDELLMLNKH